MPTRALYEHVAELVACIEAAGYAVRAASTLRLRVGAQEYKPTLFCLAPSTQKQRKSVLVREVRAYSRAEVPHVHLRAGDAEDAAHVFPLAVGVHERAAVVQGWRRQAEARLQRSCLLCHGAEAGPGHVCGAWVRVQVHAPLTGASHPHAESAPRLHEQLAYAELSGLATTAPGTPPELKLLLCVAGEQQVLAGMLNAVALATCLRTPETLAPEFCMRAEGVSLLSLHDCVEHYAGVLELDAGARAALHLHSTRMALNQQPALQVSAPAGQVLACWRALLPHRLWHQPPEQPGATISSYAVRAVRHATGQAIQAADLVRMLEGTEPALAAWPEAFFACIRKVFAHEFSVWSREARGAPQLHDAFASVAQRQRREFLFLQYVLRALGPPAVGQLRVSAAVQAQ